MQSVLLIRGIEALSHGAFYFARLLQSLNLPLSVVPFPEDHCQFSTLSGAALEIYQA